MSLENDPEDVRTRFSWARRQGNPLWLWPEIDPRNWRAALAEIDRAIRHVMAGKTGKLTVRGEPVDFGIAAFTSGMGPLLGHWSRLGLLDGDPALIFLLRKHLEHNTERMERLKAAACTAVDALADNGVRVTVLKGMHTAYSYFPVPGSRPLSDIDLLIDACDEKTAQLTLMTLGYSLEGATPREQTWRMRGTPAKPNSLSLVHRDGPWSIDLHTSIDQNYSPGAPLIKLDQALQSRSPFPWSLSRNGEVLNGAHLVLYLACHASLGLISLSMLRMTELILVIRQLTDENHLSWCKFLDLAMQTGHAGSPYPALSMTNDMAPGIIPQDVLDTLQHNTPAAVRRVVGSLTPATCQRIHRCSLTERFMWTATLTGWLREIWGSFLPPVSIGELVRIYQLRFFALLSGNITR
jgi:hypothetical protein